MRPQLLPVTKNLIIINVLLFLGTMLWVPTFSLEGYPDIASVLDLKRVALAVFIPTSKYFEPFQVVTSMFMHADFLHLLFNMIAMFFFGSAVEATLGPKRFLVYYLAAGFGALALFWIMAYTLGTADPRSTMLGASGAIYGVLVGFAYVQPNAVIQLLIPPIPLKAKYFVAGLIAIDLFGGFSNYSSQIAHFAHLGGAVTGFALMLAWSRTGGLYRP